MKWKSPPIIKIYEALGAVADGRVYLIGQGAKVYSSSRGKHYTVTYDPQTNSIMSNDNGSYWQGYLGYPAIAFLLLNGRLTLESEFSLPLKDIAWKDINTKNKNDFTKTLKDIHKLLIERGVKMDNFEKYVEELAKAIDQANLSLLGNKVKPPTGY